MEDRNTFIKIGIIAFVVLVCLDRFIYKLPNYIYIPLALIVIVLILIGGIKEKKEKNRK